MMHLRRTTLRKSNPSFIPFVAGLGVGVVATILLVPEAGRKTRNRIGDIAGRAADAMKARARNLRDRTEDFLQEGKSTWKEQEIQRRETMSDLRDKAKEKIDNATDAAKKAAGKVVDTSKDLAHSAGKKLEEGGKRLEDA
jgi:gas vesicle protein